jgi:hypothetical protein
MNVKDNEYRSHDDSMAFIPDPMYTAEAEQSMSMMRRRNSDHEFVAAQAKLMYPTLL